MKRKMKVIKEYFDSISINYRYDDIYGESFLTETIVAYNYHKSKHSSFDEAVDYLYEMAVKESRINE